MSTGSLGGRLPGEGGQGARQVVTLEAPLDDVLRGAIHRSVALDPDELGRRAHGSFPRNAGAVAGADAVARLR